METVASLLYDFDEIDVEDPMDVDLRALYAQFHVAARDKSEIELHNYLQDKVSQSKRDYTDTVSALFYGILTEPENAQAHFQCLSFVNRDHFASVLAKIHYLAVSIKFASLKTRTRDQLLWLINELTGLQVQNVEGIYLCLFRQIRSGDVSKENITFCEQMLKLCEVNKSWLDSQPRVIATAVYTFLRLLPEHRSSQLAALQQSEIRFVVRYMREKWLACLAIGRDLCRALQDVSAIPEIGQLWSDLLHNPLSFSPKFRGIDMLLMTPTPREFLRSRLTPDMEHKLLFILQNLSINHYHRNLNWFVQRYLSTSEAFFVDIIRYIVAGWYPSNQILQSDIVPRYVVIGNMLRSIKSAVVAANVKLALVFDWLFFTPNDNIMFIEPAMLLTERSAERYPFITGTIFEFLMFSVEEYYPPMRDYMLKCVSCGMKQILAKGVIRSLLPIFHCPSISDDTRKIMRFLFANFLGDVPANASARMPPSFPGSGPGLDMPPEESMASTVTSTTATQVDDLLDDDDVDRYLYGGEDTVPETKSKENRASEPEANVSTTTAGAAAAAAQGALTVPKPTVTETVQETDEDRVAPKGMPSNQAFMLFGDSMQRFISACKTLKSEEAKQNGEEMQIQLLIAKRSFNEILSVYLRMAIPPAMLAATIAGNVIDIAALLLLEHSQSDMQDNLLSCDEIVQNTAKDIFDLIMTAFWDSKEDAHRDKLVSLITGITQSCKKGCKPLVGMRWWSFIAGQVLLEASILEPDEGELEVDWLPNIVSYYESWAMSGYSTDQAGLKSILAQNLQLLGERNLVLFHAIVPLLFQHYPTVCVGNIQLLQAVANMMLSDQLEKYEQVLQKGATRMFGNDFDQASLSTMELDKFQKDALERLYLVETNRH